MMTESSLLDQVIPPSGTVTGVGEGVKVEDVCDT